MLLADLLGSVLLGALAQGCFLDASAFEAGATGAPTAGTGGGLVTTTTTTTTGGAGGAGAGGVGSGGAGAGQSTGGSGGSGGTTATGTATECSVDGDCPDPPSLCLAAKCDKGTCTGQSTAEGVVCGAAMGECFEIARCDKGDCVSAPKAKGTLLFSDFNDCKTRRCGDDGVVEEKPDDRDHLASDECRSRKCDQGQLVEEDINTGGDCVFNTGTCCQGGCCIAAGSCCTNSGACNYGLCL